MNHINVLIAVIDRQQKIIDGLALRNKTAEEQVDSLKARLADALDVIKELSDEGV